MAKAMCIGDTWEMRIGDSLDIGGVVALRLAATNGRIASFVVVKAPRRKPDRLLLQAPKAKRELR